jgi:hypothetical protein
MACFKVDVTGVSLSYCRRNNRFPFSYQYALGYLCIQGDSRISTLWSSLRTRWFRFLAGIVQSRNSAPQQGASSCISPPINARIALRRIGKQLRQTGPELPAFSLILCRENYGCEVVCFTADVGQGVGETDGLEAKAKGSGASQLVVGERCY